MRDADRLDQLRDLARLQDVLTNDATAALADARDAERAAEEAAGNDARRVDDAADHWYRHLAGPVMPERGIAIAALLVERERAARQSSEEAQQARDRSVEREQRWRAANASERATGKVVATLKRRHARKTEERALDALADRTTIDWMTK